MPERTARVVLAKFSLTTNLPLEAWNILTFEQIVVPVQGTMLFDEKPADTAKKTSRQVNPMLESQLDVKKAPVRVKKKPKKGTIDGA
jgi:hypothetical protein